MNNEEFDKRAAFIVEQQAQFASDIIELKNAVRGTNEAVRKIEDVVALLANASLRRFEDVDERIAALVDSQIRTDESLKNLIAVVDRYFSEGRNGKS